MGLEKKTQSENGELQFHCTAPATEPDPHEMALFGHKNASLDAFAHPSAASQFTRSRCICLVRRFLAQLHELCIDSAVGFCRWPPHSHTRNSLSSLSLSVNYGRRELCAVRLILSVPLLLLFEQTRQIKRHTQFSICVARLLDSPAILSLAHQGNGMK